MGFVSISQKKAAAFCPNPVLPCNICRKPSKISVEMLPLAHPLSQEALETLFKNTLFVFSREGCEPTLAILTPTEKSEEHLHQRASRSRPGRAWDLAKSAARIKPPNSPFPAYCCNH